VITVHCRAAEPLGILDTMTSSALSDSDQTTVTAPRGS
jgi:hypothetical protein